MDNTKLRKEPIMEQELVEPKQYLAMFKPITATMAECRAENEKLVFDYRDTKGNKDARSHVFKLRKVKTKINEVHKIGKAEALAACREIDAFKNKLIVQVDEMIAVHNEPLQLIDKERADAEAEALRKIEEAQAKAEAERLAELEAREAAVKAAEEKARAEIAKREAEKEAVRAAAERVEREKRIVEEAEENARQKAEEAKAKAESDAKKALEEAERRRLADIEAVKAKAKAEAEAKELAERKRIEAELAEKERVDAAEKKRQENKKHQAKIHSEIYERFVELGLNNPDIIVQSLIAGTIPYVKIEY